MSETLLAQEGTFESDTESEDLRLAVPRCFSLWRLWSDFCCQHKRLPRDPVDNDQNKLTQTQLQLTTDPVNGLQVHPEP